MKGEKTRICDEAEAEITNDQWDIGRIKIEWN